MWFFMSLFFALWTSIGILIVKKVTKDIPPILLIVLNSLLTFLFMVPLLLLTTGIPQVKPMFYTLMIPSTFLDIFASILATMAIKKTDISLISPISSFNPVFATLIAFLFLHETPALVGIAGIVFIVAGSYILNIQTVNKGLFVPFQSLFQNRGVLYFLTANFLWAITPVFQKPAIFQTFPVTPFFPPVFGTLFVGLTLLPVAIPQFRRCISAIKKHLLLLLIAGFFSSLAQYAAFEAFSHAQIGYVTAIFKLSILFTILWGALFLKEKQIKERLAGALVMILGTILLVV